MCVVASLVGWLDGRLASWLGGWWLVGWSVGWLVSWLVALLVCQLDFAYIYIELHGSRAARACLPDLGLIRFALTETHELFK